MINIIRMEGKFWNLLAVAARFQTVSREHRNTEIIDEGLLLFSFYLHELGPKNTVGHENRNL